MTIDTSKLAASLNVEEGRRRSVYYDSLGYASIAVGLCIDGRKGCGLYDDEIDWLLQRRIDRAVALIQDKPWFIACAPWEPRQRALADMAFELGDGLFAFKASLAAIEKLHFDAAANNLSKSLWATKQVPKRAARIIKVIRTGQDV